MGKTKAVAPTPAKKAAASTKTGIKHILPQLKSLRATELMKLKDEIDKLVLGQAMVLNNFPKTLKALNGKFEVFDNGPLPYNECKIPDIFADIAHKYTLKWKDGEELVIVYGQQEGVMHAGTTMFEVQGVQIGSLTVVRSFPEGDRLPETTEGAGQLLKILKKHEIETEEHFCMFCGWILDEVIKQPTDRLKYPFMHGELYFDDEDDE